MIHHLGTIHRHGEEGLLPSLVCHGPPSLVGHIVLGMTSRYHAFPDIIADVGLTFGYFVKSVPYSSWVQACSLVPVPGRVGVMFYKQERGPPLLPAERSLAPPGIACPDERLHRGLGRDHRAGCHRTQHANGGDGCRSVSPILTCLAYPAPPSGAGGP
jgi:hypothetical protein